jgi:putative Ca2+/H+ antiporter (TMEM165/GDT1 family)
MTTTLPPGPGERRVVIEFRRAGARVEALLISTAVVALAEMGDKTQLLSLVLAARFRRPIPIILGILAATLLNHALAALGGAWIASLVGPDALRWVLGLSFIAMGIWTLVPDKLDATQAPTPGASIFAATFASFFLAEMGDKTQIATVALAAQFPALAAVVVGTTLGMLLANVPVVILGEKLTAKIPLRVLRALAAAVFAILGIAALAFGPDAA